MQEAHQGHRRARRHRQALRTRSTASWSSDAEVPGFRPGKAPRKIVERRFNKEVERPGQGPRCCWPASSSWPRSTTSPRSARRTSIPDKIEIPEKGPFVYEFDVEVRPRVRPAQLQGPQAQAARQDLHRRRRGQGRAPHPVAATASSCPSRKATPEIGDYPHRRHDHASTATRSSATSRKSRSASTTQLAFKDGVAEKFGEQIKGAKAGDKRDRRHRRCPTPSPTEQLRGQDRPGRRSTSRTSRRCGCPS